MEPLRSEAHAHLDEATLWDFAEVLAHASAPSQAQTGGPPPADLAAALACGQCGPRLRDAQRQIAALRALPEVKTPPDFLLRVQERLGRERSPWLRLRQACTEALRSRRSLGLPMGFASAILLVAVLVVVLPQRQELPAPGAVSAPKPPESNRPATVQLSPSPVPVSPMEDAAQEAVTQSPAPPAKAASRPAAPAPLRAKVASARPAEKPRAVSGESHGPQGALQIMNENRDEEQKKEPFSRPSVDLPPGEPAPAPAPLAGAAPPFPANETASSALLSRLGPAFSIRHFGDTLRIAGPKTREAPWRRLADSLGLGARARFEVRADTVFLDVFSQRRP